MNADDIWYSADHPLARLLAPLGMLYCGGARLRAWAYRHGWLRRERVAAPVIVVGNLSVGGTGKTPLVLWMAGFLRERGWRPGIATRGYAGRRRARPRLVPARGDAAEYGDEAVLLAERAGVPVAAARDRVAAARYLIEKAGCDLILTDDGLQHYRLARDLEVLVIDGQRGFGNGRCLPAGPLREPIGRARHANLRLRQGGDDSGEPRMYLVPGLAVNLGDPRGTRALAQFVGQRVQAVAGIAHAERFFTLLERHGLRIARHSYPDHHRFRPDDAANWRPGPVLMTEKDAVKCRAFATAEHWYLPVTAQPEAAFVAAFARQVANLTPARASQQAARPANRSQDDHP